MLVTQVTYTWVMFEYEYKIRHGSLSFALLRPIHPIHTDLVDNISSKLITLPLMLLAATVLVLVFKPTFSLPLWAAALFVPLLSSRSPSSLSWNGPLRCPRSGPRG